MANIGTAFRTAWKAFVNASLPSTGVWTPDKAEIWGVGDAIEARLTTLEDGQQGGAIAKVLWSDLEAIVGAYDGQKASTSETSGDTHVDPLTGDDVPNKAVFSWKEPENVWTFFSADDYTLKADKSQTADVPPGAYYGAFSGNLGAGLVYALAKPSDDDARRGTDTTKPMNSASTKVALDDRLRDAQFVDIDDPDVVGAMLDPLGAPWIKGRTDGKIVDAYDREVVVREPEPATFRRRDRMLAATYGGYPALDVGDGVSDILDTWDVAFNLQPAPKLESYAARPSTGTVGFNPGVIRERAIVPVLRAMSLGPLADANIIADLAGVFGSTARLSGLGPNSAAFANLVANVKLYHDEAYLDGQALGQDLSFGVAGLFWRDGEDDYRDALDADGYLTLYKNIDKALRAAIADKLNDDFPHPVFRRQRATHAMYVDRHADSAVEAEGRSGEVANSFVVGPGYIYDHVAAAPGSPVDSVDLTPYGHRYAGAQEAAAYLDWVETGRHECCEMIRARRHGPRLIETTWRAPVAPFRISTETVAELLDGHHGAELWSDEISQRYAIERVRIADVGDNLRREATVLISSSEDLPSDREVKVWNARSSDVAGTVSGAYYAGRQPGPQTGPRSTFCDSRKVAGQSWAFKLLSEGGDPLDLSNYATMKGVVAE